MKKHYLLIGWRLTKEQREEIKNMGLYVYQARSWDEGTGCTLEHRVWVNHEADVITDFEALDPNDKTAFENDLFEFMDKEGAVDDNVLSDRLKGVLK